MQNAFDFYLPTRLCFGSGARRRLPEQLTRLGVRNLLLCTDKMLRSAGVVEKITSILDGCADVRYTIYDDVTENPGNSVVDNGYALARELGCDGVLGLGGGSALDTATGVAMLMTNGGRALDYFHGKPVAHPSLPTILLPTTSGTGSEVNRCFVVTDRGNGLQGRRRGRFDVPRSHDPRPGAVPYDAAEGDGFVRHRCVHACAGGIFVP